MRGRAHTFQCLGFLLCLMSAATLGLGVADIILNQINCSNAGTCSPLTTPLVLTWVGVGIWASIPVFATGLALIHFGRQPPEKQVPRHSWLSALIFMSLIFFTPAMIGISIAEVVLKFSGIGPPSMSDPAMNQTRFALPVAIAVIALLDHLMLMYLFITMCCCKKRMKKEAKHVEQPHSQLPQQPSAATSTCPQHANVGGNDVDRMNLWSAYRWMNVGPSPSCGCGGGAPKPAAAAANYYTAAGGAPPTRAFHVNGLAPAAAGAPQLGSASIYQYPRPMVTSSYAQARW